MTDVILAATAGSLLGYAVGYLHAVNHVIRGLTKVMDEADEADKTP